MLLQPDARLNSALLELVLVPPTPEPETNLFSIGVLMVFLFTNITRPAPPPDDGAGLKNATRLPFV